MNCIIPLAMRYKDEFLALQNENCCNIEMYCIDDNVNNISSNHVHTHASTVEHVSNAITHLKSEKSDNLEGLTSDNFRNGTHLLNVYISLLFSIMLSHGVAPAGLLLSTMVPLIKNKRGNIVTQITIYIGLLPLAVFSVNYLTLFC